MEPEKKAKKLPTCPSCGNRLRLRADQVGTQVRCPKCAATFIVGRPGKRPAPSGDEMYEPEVPLNPSSIVKEQVLEEDAIEIDTGEGTPTAAQQPEYRSPQEATYDVDWATADHLEMEDYVERPVEEQPDYVAIAKAKGMLREPQVIDVPRWTYFSGVLSFPWHAANIFRWVAMSCGLTLAALSWILTVNVIVGGISTNLLAVPMLCLFTAVLTLLSLSFCAPCFISAVQDTSELADVIQEGTMPDWDQWFFSFLSLLYVSLLSGSLGLGLMAFAGIYAVPISMLVYFPIFVLSALEVDSFLFPMSSLTWLSLLRRPGDWLMFYILSSILVLGWLTGFDAALQQSLALAVLAAGPTLAAVMLLYARLLGRLAWKIDEDHAEADRQTARSKGNGRGKKMVRRNKRRLQSETPEWLGESADTNALDDANPSPGPNQLEGPSAPDLPERPRRRRPEPPPGALNVRSQSA